jgi:ketosteroid isomerase-like protein
MRAYPIAVMLTAALGFRCAHETVDRPPPPPVDWESLKPRPPAPAPKRPTATDKERAVASAYTQALSAPDFTALSALLDEEVHFRFAGTMDAHGRDKALLAHEALLGRFEARHVVASRVLLTDSAQVLEWNLVGVDKASRKPVGFKGVALLWTKDDGSLSDVHLYFDEAVVNAQLGKGPKALAGLTPVPLPTPLSTGERQVIEQQQGLVETANVKLVRAELQALDDYQLSAYLATMADDVELWTLQSSQPAKGKLGARGYYQTMANAISNLAISVESSWGIGRFVAVEYNLIGEQRQRLGWIPAQNSVIKLSVVDVVEVRDGKIARIFRYDDPMQLVSAP